MKTRSGTHPIALGFIAVVCSSIVSPLVAHTAGPAPTVTRIVADESPTATNFGTKVYTPSAVEPPTPNTWWIENGKETSSNLFHSLTDFALVPGDRVNFSTPGTCFCPNDNVQNIITRITNAVDIAGTVDTASQYPNARLWLVSPAGITLRNGAKFVVNGALNLTTADYLTMGGSRFFWSTGDGTNQFTTDPISGFGFLGKRTGTITMATNPVAAASTINLGESHSTVVAGAVIIEDTVNVNGSGSLSLATTDIGQIGYFANSEGLPLVAGPSTGNSLGRNITIGKNVTIKDGSSGLLSIGDTRQGLNSIPSFSTPSDVVYVLTTTTIDGWTALSTKQLALSFLSNDLPLEPSTSGTLTVSLGGRTANPIVVDLATSDSSIATATTSVTISPGKDQASFNVNAGATGGTATVTARVRNTSFSSIATVRVLQPPAVESLNAPVSLDEDTQAIMEIVLNRAPAADVIIDLSSSTPEVINVPTSVTIRAGQTSSGSVGITAGQEGTANITARVRNSTIARTATILVSRQLAVLSLSGPGTLHVGGQGNLTIVLNRPASVATLVDLSATSSAVSLNSPVTVQADQTSVSVPVTGVQEGPVTITAQIRGSSIQAPTTIQVAAVTSPPHNNPDQGGTSDGNIVPPFQPIGDNAPPDPRNSVAAVQNQGQNQTQAETQSQNSRISVSVFGQQSIALASARCAASKKGEISSFFQTGRDVTPPQPGGFLSSPVTLEGESLQLGGLSLQQSGIAARRLGLLTLGEGVVAFLDLKQGCGS